MHEKQHLYDDLYRNMQALLDGESDRIARYSNFSSLVFHSLADLNWAGFYFLQGDSLVVGPFQGKPACFRIPLSKGVCGCAARSKKTVIVPNVHEFPDHIACDGASNSEIVVPLFLPDGTLFGVFDVDSFAFDRFDEQDRAGLEKLVQLL